jgi:hypothetical protein
MGNQHLIALDDQVGDGPDCLTYGVMLVFDPLQFLALDQRIAADGDKNKLGVHGLPPESGQAGIED